MTETLAALGGMLLGLVVGAAAMRERLAASRVVSAACDDVPAEVVPTGDDGPTYVIRFDPDMPDAEIAEFRQRFWAAQRPAGDGWDDAAELVGHSRVPARLTITDDSPDAYTATGDLPRDADVEQWAEARAAITPDPGYYDVRPGNAQYPRRTT